MQKAVVSALIAVIVVIGLISTVSSQCSSVLTHTQDYWTPERIKSAIPRDEHLRQIHLNSLLKSPPSNLKTKPPSAPLACTGTFNRHTDPRIYSTYPYTAVGKVFFSFGTNNYVCSGSIGANSQTVWTAGHCTYDKDLGYATNFMFIPAYYNRTNEPFGRFYAHSLCASPNWQGGNMPYDYAVARFDAKFPSGTGSLGLEYNLNPDDVEYVSFGYPAADPFDGQWENTCTSRSCGRDWWMTDPQPVGIACDSTGGSSGGPWIRGGKSIVGLNSYGYFFQRNQMWGPYFDADTLSFYERFGNIN